VGRISVGKIKLVGNEMRWIYELLEVRTLRVLMEGERRVAVEKLSRCQCSSRARNKEIRIDDDDDDDLHQNF
jgi:hypothetical protein